MSETHLELSRIRCPRCAGQLVLRIEGEEVQGSVRVTLDTACVACGVSPWAASDQRLLVFRPGAPIAGALGGDPSLGLAEASADLAGRLAAAQARVDSLLRRCDALETELATAHRALARATQDERRRQGTAEAELREDISRLEGALADARAEVRRTEEATRAEVSPGKRPIEME